MATLTCPHCGGTRICQTMQVLIEYVVAHDDQHGIDIDEPAEVIHGHVQYDPTGPADPDTLYCGSDACGYEGPVATFIPAPAQVATRHVRRASTVGSARSGASSATAAADHKGARVSMFRALDASHFSDAAPTRRPPWQPPSTPCTT